MKLYKIIQRGNKKLRYSLNWYFDAYQIAAEEFYDLYGLVKKFLSYFNWELERYSLLPTEYF